MELGFTTMNTPQDVRPDVLARALEARGYASLFIGEHSHIPASRRTAYPTGGEMPDQYRRMMDPFVSLTMAALATERLQIGTGVCLVLEHHVLDLAKSVATLDLISGGRLVFGVGVGWNAEELANHRPDIPWAQRYRATEECVAALRTCWTDDDSTFHGEFFDFDAVWSFPKPLQRPHPPIVLGTSGRLGTVHAVRWADEWMPMDIGLGDVARKITRFRAEAAAAGREIPISLVTFGDPTPETLHAYSDLGVVRTVIGSGAHRLGRPGDDDAVHRHLRRPDPRPGLSGPGWPSESVHLPVEVDATPLEAPSIVDADVVVDVTPPVVEPGSEDHGEVAPPRRMVRIDEVDLVGGGEVAHGWRHRR